MCPPPWTTPEIARAITRAMMGLPPEIPPVPEVPAIGNPVVNEHSLIVSLAAAEYERDGVVSVTTYMAMTNAGLMADEIINDIEETTYV